MDTFLRTTTLEPRTEVVLRAEKSPPGQTGSAKPSDEFFTVLRVELLKALSPYSEACKAASQAFERIFTQFGID